MKLQSFTYVNPPGLSPKVKAVFTDQGRRLELDKTVSASFGTCGRSDIEKLVKKLFKAEFAE